MNACSSRSIPALAIRYGQSAVHETEVIDIPFYRHYNREN